MASLPRASSHLATSLMIALGGLITTMEDSALHHRGALRHPGALSIPSRNGQSLGPPALTVESPNRNRDSPGSGTLPRPRYPTRLYRAVSLVPRMASLGKEIILLGFFDGIGTAAWALQSLVGPVKAYFSWEISSECITVLNKHFPAVLHRGDLCADDPVALVQAIKEVDPDGRCVIVITAGPPCPDYSLVADSAQGRAGEEGKKFVTFVGFLDQLVPQLAPRETYHIIENVVMANPADVQFFSTALKSDPIVLDAADFGLINRPRIFWCKLQWKQLQTNPMTGKPMRWGRRHKLPHLHLDVPFTEVEELDLDGHQLPPAVAHHHSRLPCLTTPSPTEQGRPPPKKLRGRIDPDSPEMASRFTVLCPLALLGRCHVAGPIR